MERFSSRKKIDIVWSRWNPEVGNDTHPALWWAGTGTAVPCPYNASLTL
jgi:hypothetical protein